MNSEKGGLLTIKVSTENVLSDFSVFGLRIFICNFYLLVSSHGKKIEKLTESINQLNNQEK